MDQQLRPPGQAGFALLVVLWAVVLLALLGAHIEAAGRSEAMLALNLRRAAALRAEADGAVAVAAFHLLDAAGGHWVADGRPYVLRVSGGFTERVAVRIVDQAGKINLNTAPSPLLQALIQAAGADAGAQAAVSPAAAGALAGNITAWRFPGGGPDEAALAAKYKASGHDYAPPEAPFESLSELGLVLGMTPPLLNALRPHLTLFHPGDPDPALADPVVRRALGAAGAAPAGAAPEAGLHVLAITATAYGAGGAAFTRRAIVRIGPQKGGWLRILTWTAPADARGLGR